MRRIPANPQRPAAAGTRVRGFTLIEVMIALVIFSIGLLGLAGLQAVSINSNQSAYLRSIAMQQAYNMADRLRNNVTGADNGDYDNITSTISVPPTDCTAAACSLADLAKFDAYEWNTMNKRELPSGRGTVKKVAGSTDQFDVTVMWDEDRTGATGENCSGNSAVDLKCYSLVVEP